MAQGRSRNSKRSTNSSHTSTITTIVFIALCVLGVWMLTSNSLAPQKTTKRISDSSSRSGDAGYSSRSRVEKKNSNPVYEDGPGELPDEAVKKEDHNHHDAENNNAGDDDSATSQSDAVGAGNNDEGQETVSTTTSEETEREGNDQNKADNENQQPMDETEKQVTDQNENPAPEEGSGAQNQQENNDESASRTSESSVEAHNSAQEEHDSSTEQVLELPSEVQESEGNKGREDNPAQDNPRDEGFSTEDSKHMEQSTGTSQEQKPEQMEEDQGMEKSEADHSTMSGEREETQQKDDGAQGESSESSQSSSNDVQDSQNSMPEDERQKRIEEQQQQRKEDQLAEDSTQPQPDSSGSEQEEQQDESEQQQQQQEVKSQSPKEDSSFPGGDNVPKESKESKKSWVTQADQSENQKERRQTDSESDESIYGYSWQLCNTTAGPDYIPCLDNEKALSTVHITGHYEHRERHCPEEGPTCLVPVPEGYQKPIEWPKSREKIWYHNVPHPLLASVKGHQNWVKVTGEFLTFPGGGTQFIHGALHYIDFLQTAEPNIKWGKHTRVVLDVGCGVASFGGFQFERDVLTMSFAPKDEHEAQVQFALERGIPAISAVMGTQRLPFPSRVFDLVHCARCRVPWHIEGGRLLLELNRVLRPGGFFVWSATPVYQKLEEDVQIWKAMSALTASMCWELVTIQKDAINSIGAAIFRKPRSNTCYEERKQNVPPMCKDDDDPNAAWYVPLQACMHRVPTDVTERGARWPVVWPRRLRTAPSWLNSSQIGIYGKPAPQDFQADYEHWKQVVSTSYMSRLGITWSGVRNVMDMRAVYGGFAAALKDLQMWVMNVVNIDSPDTLPIIYERGLFGIYHDWCESFSTYPRTYDLLHADHLFSKLKKRCKLAPVLAEVDRIVRPGGKLIVRDESGTIGEVENLLKSLHWEVHLTFSKNQEGILSAQKGNWRPNTFAERS